MSDARGFDVAVVGGGLVGTALAYELVTAGASVVLVDRHDPGRATDAGAGILSPESISNEDPSWFELALGAGEHYRTLVPVLEADGGRETGYAVTGLLRVGFREWEDDLFATNIALARDRCPTEVEAITTDEARRRFPPLGDIRNAWYSKRAARVDGRSMTAALLDAATAAGVTVVADGAATLVTTGGRVTGVVTAGGRELACGAVTIAGGAWTPEIGDQLDVTIPIVPMRGQIVHVRLEGVETDAWPIVSPLLSQYIVPWPGGRVVVGATVEPDAGFDARATAAGMRQLFGEMLRLAPGLGDATFLEIRAGLRPVSADDAPVLGRLPGWDNAYVCTGHGANGLLLGPYSAHLVATLISGGEPAMDIGPFGPERFASDQSRANRDATPSLGTVFADLLAHPGVTERVELRSGFGFMAIHGGSLERGTAEIATRAADAAGASLYTVVQPDDFRLHLPSHLVVPECSTGLAGFLADVDEVVSIHGYGRDGFWTRLLLGGRDRELATRVGRVLRAELDGYEIVEDLEEIPLPLRGLHPENPVNRTRGGGVQLELPPRVRGLGPHGRTEHADQLVAALATLGPKDQEREG